MDPQVVECLMLLPVPPLTLVLDRRGLCRPATWKKNTIFFANFQPLMVRRTIRLWPLFFFAQGTDEPQ